MFTIRFLCLIAAAQTLFVKGLPLKNDSSQSDGHQDGQVIAFQPVAQPDKKDIQFVILTEDDEIILAPNQGNLQNETTTTPAAITVTKEEVPFCEEDGSECPPHAELACPTKCDPSCSRPLLLTSQCPKSSTCHRKKCRCFRGHVYDEKTKKCILPQYCPEKCQQYEVWQLCPSACQVHCGNYQTRENATCPEDPRDDFDCVASCVCQRGFIRDLVTSRCVPRDQCADIVKMMKADNSRYPCPANEHWEECGNFCTKFCHGSSLESEKSCRVTEECQGGCVCNKGFIRLNEHAKCIPEKDCMVMLKYIDTS